LRRWIKKSAGTINKLALLSLKKPAPAETALSPCGDSAAIPWPATHDIVAIPAGNCRNRPGCKGLAQGVSDSSMVNRSFPSEAKSYHLLERGSGSIGTIDSYIPHVVGGVKFTQGWGAITGVVAYDSNYEEVAGKVRLGVTPMENLSLFIMAGYGTDDNLSDGSCAGNASMQWIGRGKLHVFCGNAGHKERAGRSEDPRPRRWGKLQGPPKPAEFK
jgi:hypothetical protein